MQSRLDKHIEVLRKDVFEINTKWPQFDLLINDLIELSNKKEIKSVCALERTLLYGGYSLIGPIFQEQAKSYYCIDCSPESAEERGAYCDTKIISKNFIQKKMNIRKNIENLDLDLKFDLIVIPNLVHHLYDQEKLIKSSYNLLNKKGKLYIFEPTIRELHQIPNDYLRWTPYGLNKIVESKNFKLISQKETGNAFEAIKYCWYQAIEYLDSDDRSDVIDWLENEQLPFINKLINKSNNINQIRKFTRFPTAFSCLYEKI